MRYLKDIIDMEGVPNEADLIMKINKKLTEKGITTNLAGKIKVCYDEGIMYLTVRDSQGGFILQVNLQEFYLNCGIVIISGLSVFYNKGNGLAKIFLDWLLEILTSEYVAGYSYVLATTNESTSNQIFRKIALQAGFKEIDTFLNLRSENDINVLSYNVDNQDN